MATKRADKEASERARKRPTCLPKKGLLLQDSRLLKTAGDYTRIRDLDAW